MATPRQNSGKWKRVVITFFIIVHAYIMCVWGLPGSRFRSTLSQPVQDYVLYAGLWHSWDMFSPDPLAVNFRVQAEITYANGAMEVWEFPRMQKLGLWERFYKERYRKWRERVRQDAYRQIWNDTARYIARLHRNPENPPRHVTLIRRWQPIPPPRVDLDTNNPANSPVLDFQRMPEELPTGFHYRFHQYPVRLEDFE